MSKDIKHTPLPPRAIGKLPYVLKHIPHEENAHYFDYEVSDANNKFVFRQSFCALQDTAKDSIRERMEFIVKACNSHYELLEALKYLLDRADGCGTYEARLQAKAAIAKAEGKANG